MDETLISTTRGLMPASQLERRDGVVDDDNERTTWVEYWHEGALVHRSAHVTIKHWPDGLGAMTATFG